METTPRPNAPRPEYPRPMLMRPEWLCLNGEWEFAFDDAEAGIAEGWSDGRRLSGRIQVPFPYQSKLSGIGDTAIHEVVWYARSFRVPPAWNECDLLLHFGAVDYRSTVWLNGREVGHNRGGHVPFTFDIAPYVQPGENRLAVRVEDRQDARQPRGKQSSSGLPHGIDYYCTTGIWQSVWLEPAPPIRIDEIRVTPILEEDALHLHVYLHAPAIGWTIQAEAFADLPAEPAPGGSLGALAMARSTGDACPAPGVEAGPGAPLVSTRATTDQASGRLLLRIPNAQRWTSRTPTLYGLSVRLLDANGHALDEVASYAGIRDVRVKGRSFQLNGQPEYLALVLDQGYWPDGYLAAPSDAALRADVEAIKAMGFNGARKHQKIEDPRWLMWCDRLGLLVWEEMPNGRAWSSEAEERLLAEWERAVRRDYNHPCIVCWVPVNESMGFPDIRQGHPGQYAFLERAVAATRRQDPNRPVIDNDGWEHTDITDIVAVHDYSHTGEALRKRYAHTVHSSVLPDRTWTRSRAIFADRSLYRGQPVMLTEVGGILMRPDAPGEKLDKLYEVYASIDSEDELLERYRELMQGIADLPFVSGFCYTQLTDVEQEINGLLTYDRRPKVDPAKLAAIHRELFRTI